MLKKSILVGSLSVASALQATDSPFLITSESLPHVTKLIQQHWDTQDLALSNEQKNKLLPIRTHTIEAVKELKERIYTLEEEVIEGLVDEASLESLEPKIDEIAKLKASNTKIQLQCLKKTLSVLNDKQIKFLLPFWGM